MVVLGEDFLLADVLALGVEPVAATATLGSEFVGIERDTHGIEPLDQLQLNAEQVAALRPDTIITNAFIAEQAGVDVIESIAETIVVPDNPSWRAQLAELAGALGAQPCAEQLLETYDDAVAAADELIDDDLAVSMATVYPGENIGVWVEGPANIPATFLDVGIELTPGAGTYDDVTNGRAYVSTERLDDLAAELLVLLQSSSVEGEDASLEAVRSSPLWGTLPAVQAGRVVEIDRLGYPGIEGRTRLAAELPQLLGMTGPAAGSGSNDSGRTQVPTTEGTSPAATGGSNPTAGSGGADPGPSDTTALPSASPPPRTGRYTYALVTENGEEQRTMQVSSLGGNRQKHTDRYQDGTVDGRDVSYRPDGLFVERVEPPGFACDVEPDLPQLRFPLATGASWSATADCDNLVADVDLDYTATVRGTGTVTIAGSPVEVWIIDSVLVTVTRVPTQENRYRTARVDHFDPRSGLIVKTDYDLDGRERSETLLSLTPA